MKEGEKELMRLLRAASGEKALPENPPFGFETRSLERWRAGASTEDFLVWLSLFKRTVIAACLIMIVSIAVGYPAMVTEPADESAITDLVIQMSFTP